MIYIIIGVEIIIILISLVIGFNENRCKINSNIFMYAKENWIIIHIIILVFGIFCGAVALLVHGLDQMGLLYIYL